MNVFIVDDDFREVSAYIAFFEAHGHKTERCATFSAAYCALADPKKHFDLLVIDIMLAWGNEISDASINQLSWVKSGIFLVKLIRGIDSEEVKILRRDGKLPEWRGQHLKDVPVIFLTKVQEFVEDEFVDVPGVTVIQKTPGDIERFKAAVEEVARLSP